MEGGGGVSAVETTIAKRNTPCEANLDGCTGGRTVLGGRAGRHCHCFRCVWDPLLGGVAIRSPIETAPPESSQKCCSAPLPLPPPPPLHTYVHANVTRRDTAPPNDSRYTRSGNRRAHGTVLRGVRVQGAQSPQRSAQEVSNPRPQPDPRSSRRHVRGVNVSTLMGV